MEASEIENQKNKKRNRRVSIGFFALGITCLVCIIGLFYQRSQLGSIKSEMISKTDALSIALDGNFKILSDSLDKTAALAKKTAIMVNDTMYPVIVGQQDYLKKFDKSLLSQDKKITNVIYRLKKNEKTIESFGSNQVSFARVFNEDLEKIKGRIDTTKLILPNTGNNQMVLSLPGDTSKTKLLVLDGDKKTGQGNGDHGGQKKKGLGLKRLFGGQK